MPGTCQGEVPSGVCKAPGVFACDVWGFASSGLDVVTLVTPSVTPRRCRWHGQGWQQGQQLLPNPKGAPGWLGSEPPVKVTELEDDP